MPGFTRPVNVPQEFKEYAGAYIRQRRLALGMTQAELVAAIGRADMWSTALSSFETGDHNLPPHMWMATADALRIERAAFGKLMLRWTNPWAYLTIYGPDPELEAAVACVPDQYSAGSSSRRPTEADAAAARREIKSARGEAH